MITRRTRVQLLVFVLITLLGVTYVGARYAQLDRVFVDRSYEVVAHYPESGGIFVGGEVTYRGVRIGQVSDMILTDEGVDVVLDIDNEWDSIPADTKAVVGNRSAVGEQYVELQPNVDPGTDVDYLADGSEIVETEVPIRTEKLLADVSETVASVDRESLQTTVRELGIAFGDTGEDLQRIIDTGNAFIEAADENFDVTTALIRDGNTVLQGQVDSESSLRTFADELSKFSTTLAGADDDLRKVIDTGSFTANQLRTFLEENQVPIADLLRNLVATGEVVVRRLPEIEHLLVIFPWVVDGTWTVVAEDNEGRYNAHFGLVLSTSRTCKEGYGGTRHRPPGNGDYWKINAAARCAEAAARTNARGPQNLPRVAPGASDDNVLGTFDIDSGEFEWGTRSGPGSVGTGSVMPPDLGKDAWKWLYLQPLLDHRR
jgi:phospholipid/cholesterol/gamma-HCH transport system substrate-binding protein